MCKTSNNANIRFDSTVSELPWIKETPNNWKKAKVKNIFVIKNSKARQINPVVLTLARSGVRVRDISTNEGQLAESYFNYNPVSPGDLLLNPMDLISGANCSISNVEGVISPAYTNLKAIKGLADPRYYDYYFKIQYWSMSFFSRGKGVSYDNRWTLNNQTLMNYPVIIPPLSEQIKIADYLDHQCGLTDDIILNLTNKIDALDQYKKSLIKEKVTTGFNNDDLIESGVSWIGKIPEHWRMIPNKYLFIETTRKVGSKWDSYQLLSLTTEGVKEKDIEQTGGKIPESYNKYLIIKEGQMIFCLFDLDVSAVFSGLSPYNGMITSAYNAYNVNESIADKRYIKYFFDFVFTNRSYKYYSKNLRYSVSADQFKNIKTLVPPLSEQTEIADYLDKKCELIDEIKNDIEKEIEILKKYKKSLIFEYVTGKKVVSNEQDSI